jgi:flagellar hook-associated protein 1 FlgK
MQDETAAQALVDHAEAWRSSVAGVSVDEEMVNLISQQEAYTAAARLVSVADQMIQEMLRMIT